MTESISYVRDQFIEAKQAPASQKSTFVWIRDNFFASWRDGILTVLAVATIAYYMPKILNWLFISAVWSGVDRTACLTTQQGGQLPADWSGACWAFVNGHFVQFMFGSYPRDELWRPLLVVALFVALLVPFLMPKLPRKGLSALLLLVVFPIISAVLLLGGVIGLRHVETSLWGGLMVTLIISFIGIITSLPIGILLALGRRSSMPLLRVVCVTFIELIRGVPLITVLFIAGVLLPLFLEPGDNIDKFLRALIGVSIFTSAYMAEVIRGGLQAIPKGQYEAADSLGLNYIHKMAFIVLPQAIKLVIPGIVNTFIGLLKDTSLVSIISMFDLLGIVKASFGDYAWITPVTPLTGLIFAGFVFWILCFGMSRYSAFIERRLDKSYEK